MSKSDKIKNFDPNSVGVNNGHFIGLPFEEEEADLLLLSMPWDVTVSYGAGTSSGPDNILKASTQLDLHDADYPNAWHRGIYMRRSPDALFESSRSLRPQAEVYIQELEAGKKVEDYPALKEILDQVNLGCMDMVSIVRKMTSALMEKGKLLGIVGGDHSCSLGYLQALAQLYPSFGVLQIDAHQDLRKAYEGFIYSHASIFYNALQLPQLNKLVQVGIRDRCEEEAEMVDSSDGRISCYLMDDIRRAEFTGSNWSETVDKIIADLPEHVYISFDIDGLDPMLCPNTGTPVPDGLSYSEARYLLKRVSDSGKKIIGFDLCEVAGGKQEWDGNVGARVLYTLCGAMLNQSSTA